MRSRFLIGLILLVAACTQSSKSIPTGEPDGLGGGDAIGKSACKVNADCVAAAATCCDCPAFAINGVDPSQRACAGVMCPGDRTCPDNVTAACEEGFCVLACVEMACSETCAAGYMIEPTGCLSCACAATETIGCSNDGDCVQTRADCCGCAQGGTDTAVLATEQAGFDAALQCSGSPTCPRLSVCDPNLSPRCIQGQCALTEALPGSACGRPDLPPCAANEVCTVNTAAGANMQGVGVCVPV